MVTPTAYIKPCMVPAMYIYLYIVKWLQQMFILAQAQSRSPISVLKLRTSQLNTECFTNNSVSILKYCMGLCGIRYI